MQAVIDLPAQHFDEVGAFWQKLTGSRRGEMHPDHDEFVHLLPPSGARHLELQRIEAGPARAHLDLLVNDIDAATGHAVESGASLIAQPGHAVLRTPGGVPFCIVPFGDETERAPVIDANRPHAVDQICLDIPHQHFQADIAFWSRLTGWDVHPDRMPEFRSFAQPAHLPLRILLQQLGADDAGEARAHLDISSGEHVDELVVEHQAAGATVVEQHEYWTALRDPAAMPYCLTARQPRGSKS